MIFVVRGVESLSTLKPLGLYISNYTSHLSARSALTSFTHLHLHAVTGVQPRPSMYPQKSRYQLERTVYKRNYRRNSSSKGTSELSGPEDLLQYHPVCSQQQIFLPWPMHLQIQKTGTI